MTRTMKIYENGKLIETVKRQQIDWVGTPRKSIVRPMILKRNALGSNQYRTKRRSHLVARRTERPNWQKTLFASSLVLIAFILVMHGAKVLWEVKIDPAIRVFAQDNGIGQPKELISPVASPTASPSAIPTATPTPKPSVQEIKEARVAKLHTYLSDKNSPLADHATQIVSLADENDIPWTLVTAIAQKESSLCKHTAGDNNCWGITTGKKGGPRFASYPTLGAGIEAATKLLSEQYRKDMNSAIQARYCPSSECSSTWVSDVTSVQEAINE